MMGSLPWLQNILHPEPLGRDVGGGGSVRGRKASEETMTVSAETFDESRNLCFRFSLSLGPEDDGGSAD